MHLEGAPYPKIIQSKNITIMKYYIYFFNNLNDILKM